MGWQNFSKSGLLLPFGLSIAASCGEAQEARENVGKTVQAITNTHVIEGYADKLSAAQGESIAFSVHEPATAGTSYTVRFYRYGVDPHESPILMDGPFFCFNGAPRDYTETSYRDGLTWPVSFTLTIPSTSQVLTLPPCSGSFNVSAWPSGIYVARATTFAGTGDIATFIVRDTPALRKSIVLIASTNTWQAYNLWPGVPHAPPGGSNSFYDITGVSPCAASAKDDVLNFRRPNPYATPVVQDTKNGQCTSDPPLPFYRTEHLVAGETRVARWFNRNAYPYSMLTDYDIHQGWNEATKATALDPFRVVVFSTHNEYWSDAMYKSVTAYLAKGGNVISLSGNTAYWRVTIDPVTKKLASLKRDPQDLSYGTTWIQQRRGPASCGKIDFSGSGSLMTL
jgi:hypothetical protein